MSEVVEGGPGRTGDWWHEVSTVALVGTDRRPVPPPPHGWARPRAEADPAVALLDATALGAAWRSAGVAPGAGTSPEPAPDEVRPVVPAVPRQLLEVLLTQPPGGPALQPLLLRTWLAECDRGGFRLPHESLTRLLRLATDRRDLRRLVVPVAGARGAWLATLDPALAWFGGEPRSAPSDDGTVADLEAEWAGASSADRVPLLLGLRQRDPVEALRLLEGTWTAEPARARADQLGTLRWGLGPHDEPLLERALDDRAAGVRDTAYDLLDRLPDSARAHRMGERLRPLLGVSGMLRRTVAVEDPADPDPAAVRDGLRPPPKGTSARAHHLQRIVRGAPLRVWTEATGLGPAALFAAVRDDAVRGLLHAAVVVHGAGQPEWVRAAFAVEPSGALVPLLPASEQHAAVQRVLAAGRGGLGGHVRLLQSLPGPWSSATSERVVAALRRGEGGSAAVSSLRDVLAERLDPDVAPRLRAWAGRDDTPDPLRRALTALAAALTTRQTVLDAFRRSPA